MSIRILSAGAPKTAISNCAEAFSKQTGYDVSVSFDTAPRLRDKAESGTADADILVAPVPTLTKFEQQSLIATDVGTLIGSIKAAIVIHDGAEVPDISSADSLKAAMLDAESLVYNKASSGTYIEKMIERLGITDQVQDKTVRTDTGAGVMEHLSISSIAEEIGFGQQTEIQVQVDKGLNVLLVGPLPKEVEHLTTYRAGVLTAATSPDIAREFIDYLKTEAARKLITITGIAQ